MDLPDVDWKTTSWPGVRLAFLADRDDGSACVLIDMAPGVSYPEHRHRGVEEVLVVRGSYSDDGGEHLAGSFQRNEADTSHHPVAGPDGALLLAWSDQGIEVLEDSAPTADSVAGAADGE
ncbi:MAG TPA: hypothetical protein DDW23_02015 [Planctomycetes bacterium]|nr:hypothetical protein [Planctomycetota bacterium]|tara:strand:+ start:559 stop:918 length:360 start_codon:yes stop_codon:yes gene_type:complete